MTAPNPVVVALACHPATPGPAGCSIRVEVERVGASELRLGYHLEAAPEGVVLPPPRPAERRDELWRHTCCEAFVAAGDEPGYLELNLAPSGAWALYRFAACRVGMTSPPLGRPPTITLAERPDGVDLAAAVDLSGLVAAGPLRLALAVVVEAVDGSCSYWALAHPGARPDFHHPAAFTLRLD